VSQSFFSSYRSEFRLKDMTAARRARMFHPPRIRRGAAAAIRTRRHGAAFGAAAAAFFYLFKKAVCLLNRNRNI
jgi:hypothetical protein